MINIIIASAIVLGIVAVGLVIKLILPYKPSQKEMTAYIQMMEKGGKLK
jgi:hypothetical protein